LNGRLASALAIQLGILVASTGLLVTPAMATSGEITRADADSGLTVASIAGSVERSGCDELVGRRTERPEPPRWPGEPSPTPPVDPPPHPCRWLPFVTLGPESSACSSPDRKSPDALGPGISLVWSGEAVEGDGGAQFDLTGVPLEPGDRLVCLSAIESQPEPIACVLVVGFYCPPYGVVEVSSSLDSELLRPAADQLPTATSPGGGEDVSAGSALAAQSTPRAPSSAPRVEHPRRCVRPRRMRARTARGKKCKSRRHQVVGKN